MLNFISHVTSRLSSIPGGRDLHHFCAQENPLVAWGEELEAERVGVDPEDGDGRAVDEVEGGVLPVGLDEGVAEQAEGHDRYDGQHDLPST